MIYLYGTIQACTSKNVETADCEEINVFIYWNHTIFS